MFFDFPWFCRGFPSAFKEKSRFKCRMYARIIRIPNLVPPKHLFSLITSKKDDSCIISLSLSLLRSLSPWSFSSQFHSCGTEAAAGASSLADRQDDGARSPSPMRFLVPLEFYARLEGGIYLHRIMLQITFTPLWIRNEHFACNLSGPRESNPRVTKSNSFRLL